MEIMGDIESLKRPFILKKLLELSRPCGFSFKEFNPFILFLKVGQAAPRYHVHFQKKADRLADG